MNGAHTEAFIQALLEHLESPQVMVLEPSNPELELCHSRLLLEEGRLQVKNGPKLTPNTVEFLLIFLVRQVDQNKALRIVLWVVVYKYVD